MWYHFLITILTMMHESTWFCRQLSKKESWKLLRGKVDEAFLERVKYLSGPNHVYSVDVV